MIIIRITMRVLPEKQKEVVQTLLSLTSSMEEETGCLSYKIFSNMKDKDELFVFEEWVRREHLDEHLKSDIFGVLLGTKSLLSRPHGIYIYTVQQAEGMAAVLAARRKRGYRMLKEIKI